MTDPVLSVRDLRVEFPTPQGTLTAVDGLDLDLFPGETLGIVGESGCGKSVAMLAILGLLPPQAHVVAGRVLLDGTDLLRLHPRQLRRHRGRSIGMIFQDPMTGLNPVLRIGDQIAEAVRAHAPDPRAAPARHAAVELLERVGMPEPARRARQFPHQLSGGLRQRAMIAIAIANEPRVLVADEPTTALDVTIQAQILDLLAEVQARTGAATMLITHDLGIVAEQADRVAVVYAGRVVESAPSPALFAAPRHPYTLGLLSSLPRLDVDVERLVPVPGQPPSLVSPPPGCAFHPRCTLARGRQRCSTEQPLLRGAADHASACHFSDELPGELSGPDGSNAPVPGGGHVR